jgi:hypothetical protein
MELFIINYPKEQIAETGGGNDDLPWLYTQPLQNIGGC